MNYEQQLRVLLESAAKKEKALADKKIPLKQEKQKDTNESSCKESKPTKKMKATVGKSKTVSKKKETVESIEVLGELDLKPWKKKSAFSKAGYEKVATRQSDKMKKAEADIDAADEADDDEGIKKAGKDWKKAQSTKQKAELKSKTAKESVQDTKPVIAESQDLSNMLKLAGLKPLNG